MSVEEMDIDFNEIEDSNKLLQIPGSFRCYLCTKVRTFADEPSLLEHLQGSHPKQRDYPCDKCSVRPRTILKFNRHLERHDPVLRPFQCAVCPMRFIEAAGRRGHEVAVHGIREESNKDKFLCYVCVPSLDLEDGVSLEQHLLVSHPDRESYHCEECSLAIRNIRTYNSHLQRHDPTLRPFKCSMCPLRFLRTDNLKNHEFVIHKIGSGRTKVQLRHACPICEKRFQRDKLEQHMQKMHPIKEKRTTSSSTKIKFKCYICTTVKYLPDEQSLLDHLQASHRMSTYRCRECSFVVRTRVALNKHLARHDPSTRPYQCSVCPLRYLTDACRKQHEVDIHQLSNGRAPRLYHEIGKRQKANKKFRCHVCSPLTFHDDEELLRKHLQTSHQEPQSFRCEECNTSSTNIVTYNQHLARHDATLRPLVCAICSVRFSRRDEKKHHEIGVHKYRWRDRDCPVCKVRLQHKQFDQHMEMEHPAVMKQGCAECGRGFYCEEQLEKHRAFMHPRSEEVAEES